LHSRELSRRGFLAASAAVVGTVAAGTAAVATAVAQTASVRATPPGSGVAAPLGSPVVGFHNDRPYLDVSGRALPYVAPCGARAGEGMTVPEGALVGQFGYC